MTGANPTTFVIGAGPVATALAGALRLGGVPVLGLWARRPAQARAAGATAGVAAFSSAPPDILLETRAVLLAVRDPAVADVAAMLAGTGLIGKRHVLLHCGGSAPARERLGGVAEQVAGVGTLHPLSAISDGKAAMRALRGTVFGVEGDEAARVVAGKLVAAMGGVVLALEGAQMAAYHAAAALASNYVVAVIDAAAAVLAMAGVAPEQAAPALVPLAEGALRNITVQGTTSGLTGPVRRGDVETVRRHLQTLQDRPELAEIYRVLARRTVEIAARIEGSAGGQREDAPDRAGLEAIRALLGGAAR